MINSSVLFLGICSNGKKLLGDDHYDPDATLPTMLPSETRLLYGRRLEALGLLQAAQRGGLPIDDHDYNIHLNGKGQDFGGDPVVLAIFQLSSATMAVFSKQWAARMSDDVLLPRVHIIFSLSLGSMGW